MTTKTTYPHEDGILPRLNAVRLIVVIAIAFGYASTMPMGPNKHEIGTLFGYEPSWVGVQVIFFLSGVLAYRSVEAGRIGADYLKSRILRVFPLLLAITLTTVFVIYPLLGKPLSSTEDYLALAQYFFLTVTCLDPGRELPGLMDDALYACLIQGAIWTLRWGLFLHIAVAFGARFRGLVQPRLILSAGLVSMLLYAAWQYGAAKRLLPNMPSPMIGLHFGYIFLLGMALWAYRNHLPQRVATRYAIAAGLFGFAALNYYALPWTSFIEISLTLSLGFTAWLISTSTTSKLSFLDHWPHLAVGLYLLNWPTTQVILHAFPSLNSITLALVSLPVSLVLTLLTHWIFTGRVNSMVEKTLLRKVPVESASL